MHHWRGGGELNNYLDGSLKIDSNIFSTFYIGIASSMEKDDSGADFFFFEK